jgi:hypothetical protein
MRKLSLLLAAVGIVVGLLTTAHAVTEPLRSLPGPEALAP